MTRGYAFAFIVVAPAIALGSLASFAPACALAELKDAPDAGHDHCPPNVPYVFCEAGFYGPTTCTAPPDTPQSDRALPSNVSYPIGCDAVFLSANCNDVQIDCRCDAQDAAPAKWICSQ